MSKIRYFIKATAIAPIKKLYYCSEIRIATIYVVISGLWIIFSDEALTAFLSDVEWVTRFQTYKGWFFVFITGWMVYSLIRRENQKNDRLLHELKRAVEKSKESDRLKAAFLANMSHEIRTPLNGILGFAELLQMEGNSREDQEEYVRIINDSGNQLLSIVNDLIDISKLEAKKMVVEKKRFSLKAMNEDLHSYYRYEMENKGKGHIQFELVHWEKESQDICSDPVRLKQVMSHLLSNAIKFTEKGQITFGVSAVTASRVELFVEDTGMGISKENITQIFDPFIQGDLSTSRGYGGTGIGLSLCKELTELLGGSIQVSSQIGRGTRFTLRLPNQE